MSSLKFIYQEKILCESNSKSLFRLLKFILTWFRTLPCQFAYCVSSKKKLILSDFGSYSNIVKTLVFAKHNRNLFYHRIGRVSILFSWILPAEHTLKLPFSCVLGEHAIFVDNDFCYINATQIGNHFVCYPHVVIGSKCLDHNEKPTIGNNVTIGTGAVIVGNIRIGDNVKISANSFVNQDISNNSIVVPKQIIITKVD